MNTSYYNTISKRNDWYEWADKIARKKDNYWFAAADIVTSWRAVGAADWVNAGYITNNEEEIMRGVNEQLLIRNFTNFGKYLLYDNGCVTYNGTQYCNLKGAELEKQMVVIEQTEVEDILRVFKRSFEYRHWKTPTYCFASDPYFLTTNTPWDCATFGISRVSDGSCKLCIVPFFVTFGVNFGKDALENAKDDFKKSYPNVLYDFTNINHRVFIGQSMAKHIRIGK